MDGDDGELGVEYVRSGSAAHVARDLSTYLLDLLGVGVAYFVLAKIGLTLASINSSTSAIWPATGFALAAVLLWGYRVAPAVLIASFAANVTNIGSISEATAIALGNTLEALVAAWLIHVWCDGRATFATTTGVAKFALVCIASTMISATVGIASLTFYDSAPTALATTWMTWWLGDLAGALVIAPFVILWAAGDLHSFARTQWGEVGTIVAATIAVGIIAFSPLFDQTSYRDPLGFLALPPLLWAALRRDPRETATVVVILCCFAVWGTLAGSGPFVRVSLNDLFLLLVMFFISISVPSMALSADVQMRRRSEEQLQHAHDELAARAGELRDTAARLQASSGKLEERVERRTQELKEALQQQTALAEVFKEISGSSFDLQKLLDRLVDLAARLCTADSASIWRPSGETYQIAAAFGHRPEHRERLDRLSVRPGRDTGVGRALLERQVIHVVDGQDDPELHHAFKAGGYRTMMAVPLMREGAPIGVLVILRRSRRPFTEREIELATTVTDQAVIAIENVRLFDEVQARTHELTEALDQQTATAEVLQVISSSPGELEPVFRAMLDSAVRICGAKIGTLYLFDEEVFRAVAFSNAPTAYLEHRRSGPLRPSSAAPLGRVRSSKQVVQIADCTADQAYIEGDPLFVTTTELAGVRTLLVVPMLKEGEFVGAISIFRQEVRPFNDKQIELVKNFATQAVIAIGNARLLNELSESLEQQTATADVLKVISRSTFDLKTVLQTLVELAARLCEGDQATITRQIAGKFFRAEAYGFSPEFMDYVREVPVVAERGTVLGRALLEGKVVHIPDVLADPEYTWPEAQRLGGFRTMLGVPMLRQGIPIGVLALTCTKCARSPTSRSSWSPPSPTKPQSRLRTCACSTKFRTRTASCKW